jgi:hypothetical protein
VKILPFAWRPFRRIRWECVNEKGVATKPCFSYLDQRCISATKEPIERLLLWRPNYANLQPESMTQEETKNWPNNEEKTALNQFISQVIQDWKAAQTIVTSLTTEIRDTQSSILTAFGAFVPRTPARRHREHELVENRKSHQAMLRALSLVLNCPEQYSIKEGIVEDRIGVGTIIAEYTHLQEQTQRLIALETAGAQTLAEAQKNGRPLTRLMALNPQYRLCL